MDTPILILHGWAKDITGARYHVLKKLFEKKGYTVFCPDLPGFGTNILKKESLEFEDYVEFVRRYTVQILKQTKAKKIVLLGHSFGGRIAIRFANRYPELLKRLILIGASGIPRPLPSLKKKIIYGVTKVVRPLFAIPPFSLLYTMFRKAAYYAIGEMDYYKAGNLSETFKNVYRVSIADDLEKITAPTLIVWGENDTTVPLNDGAYMHRHIRNSKLAVIEGATHKLPYEHPEAMLKEIVAFLS